MICDTIGKYYGYKAHLTYHTALWNRIYFFENPYSNASPYISKFSFHKEKKGYEHENRI